MSRWRSTGHRGISGRTCGDSAERRSARLGLSSLRATVDQLLEAGLNKTEVGKRLGLSRHQVRRMVSKPAQSNGEAVKWGFGAAALVRPATTRETELVVFGSDFHFPYQDDRAIESFLALVKDLQPDRVVLNGDIADFFALSRFNLSGDRIDELQNEIDEANYFRTRVRAAAPNAVLDETSGNHDDRILSYVNKNAQALKSLRALKPEGLFLYKDLGINWHPGAGFLLRPQFVVKHGSMVRGEAGASAKAEFMQHGISGISGHTHRLAPYKKAGYVPRVWWEQGCFCRLDPDYVTGRPNWEQGGMVGEFSTKTESFIMHPVPFIDGKLRFGKDSY